MKAKKTTRKSTLSKKETHVIYHAAAKFAWLKIYADRIKKTKDASKKKDLNARLTALRADIKKHKLERAA